MVCLHPSDTSVTTSKNILHLCAEGTYTNTHKVWKQEGGHSVKDPGEFCPMRNKSRLALCTLRARCRLFLSACSRNYLEDLPKHPCM